MIVDIILLVAGLALIVFGADWLVDGASSVARKAGISEFVIGLTIVGFGTSCPELVVSLTGAVQGNADIAIGNVVGSNIFNVLMILGVTAVIAPVAMTRANARIDIPMTLGVTVLFMVLGLTGNGINRIEGIVMLLVFAAYIYYCFKFDKPSEGAETGQQKERSVWVAVILIAAGLAGLIFGGQLFVGHATNIAHAIGVSDKVIALTLLAGGTSLPELATCIAAAVRHKDQLAMGNVLGSNVFNILLILGCSSVITPLSTAAMTVVDFAALLFSVMILLFCAYTGKRDRVDRWEGIVMILVYVAYTVLLFMK